jgi:membrane protein implicated in regulation of membrane protease activity
MAFFTRLILTLFGMAFAVLFAVGVLFWLALYAAFASLRWLVTGQKPQVLMMWQQIQAIRKGMQTGQSARWSSWSRTSDGQWHDEHGSAQHAGAKSQVVEDVVVREIQDKRSLP